MTYAVPARSPVSRAPAGGAVDAGVAGVPGEGPSGLAPAYARGGVAHTAAPGISSLVDGRLPRPAHPSAGDPSSGSGVLSARRPLPGEPRIYTVAAARVDFPPARVAVESCPAPIRRGGGRSQAEAQLRATGYVRGPGALSAERGTPASMFSPRVSPAPDGERTRPVDPYRRRPGAHFAAGQRRFQWPALARAAVLVACAAMPFLALRSIAEAPFEHPYGEVGP